MSNQQDDWTEVGGGGGDDTPMWDRSAPVIGRYERRKDGVGRNKSKIYYLKQDDCSEIGLWSSTVLDTKMESVPRHAIVRVEYLGEATSKNGGRYNDFKVQYKLDEEAKAQVEKEKQEIAAVEAATGGKLDTSNINLDDIPF